jgi:hypothetical protein
MSAGTRSWPLRCDGTQLVALLDANHLLTVIVQAHIPLPAFVCVGNIDGLPPGVPACARK